MANTVFQGPAPLTLDSKGRIAMPARHREVLAAMDAKTVTITKNAGGNLLVFPPSTWADFSQRVAALPIEAAAWKRLFLGNATEVELDGSARLLIAQELREYADLSRDALMLGMGDYLELWDKKRYREQEAQIATLPMPESIRSFIL